MGTKHFVRVCLTGLAVMGVALLGCTRTVNQSASITINLPESARSLVQSKAATSQLSHVAINITGAGISAPVFLSWDAHNSNTAAPSSFELDNVPGGSARLIQVLAVYSSGTQIFFYGDTTQDINSDVTVNVSVTQIANATMQGNIGGQYLSTASAGPTGPLQVMYTPVNAAGTSAGKPAMLVFTTDIFNGFFSSFAIGGGTAGMPVGFNYILPDGTDMFGGPMDLAIYTPTLSGVSDLKISTPGTWNQNCNGNCGSSTPWQYNNPTNSIYGFFGPGAQAADTICYPSTATSLNSFYAPSPEPTPSPTTTPMYGMLSWSGNSSATGANVAVSGGTGISTLDAQNLCESGTTRFVDYLSFDPTSMNNGNGQGLSFVGPYVAEYSGGNRNALNVAVSGTSMTITYTYLPGVQPTVSSDVFYRITPSDYPNTQDYQDDNGGADCNHLTALATMLPAQIPMPTATSTPGPMSAINFSKLATSSETAGSTAQSLTATLAAAVGSNDNLQVILCPKADGVYFDDAGQWETNGGGGCNNCQLPPTAFKIADALGHTSPFQLQYNSCTPIYIYGLNGANPASLNSASGFVTMSSSSYGSSVGFYSDAGCTQATTTPNSAMGGPNAPMIIYADFTGTPGASGLVIATYSNGGTNFSSNANIQFDNTLTGTNYMSLGVPATILQYGCYPIVVSETITNGATYTPVPASGTQSFMLSNGTVQFYSDSSCTSTTSPTTQMINSGQATTSSSPPLYFSYTGAVGSMTIPVTGNSQSMINNTATVTAHLSASTVQFVNTPNTVTIGSGSSACSQVILQQQDGNGNPVPSTGSSGTLTVSGGNGALYVSAGCTGGTASVPVSFSAGSTTSTPVYYAGNTVGTDTLSFNGGGLTQTNTINTMPQYAMVVTETGTQNPVFNVNVPFTTTCTSGNNPFITAGQCGISLTLGSVNFTYTIIQNSSITAPIWIQSSFNGNYNVSLDDTTASTVISNNIPISFTNGQSGMGVNTSAISGHSLQFIFVGTSWSNPPVSPPQSPPQFNFLNTLNSTYTVQ